MRRLRTPEEYRAVKAATEADNHKLTSCTHYAVKDGEIVGAFTLGPVVLWWLHSEKCRFRDTAACMVNLRIRAEEMGLGKIVILCAKSSPYSAHMSRLGCELIGTTDIYEVSV